jgi:hypothetical protein
MPWLCESSQLPNNPCPTCGQQLKSSSVRVFFRARYWLGAIAILVVLGWVFVASQPSMQDRFFQIHPGMKMLDAMRVFGDDNSPPSVIQLPSNLQVILHGVQTYRTMPIDLDLSGEVTYSNNRDIVCIRYSKNKVVSVRFEPDACLGFRRVWMFNGTKGADEDEKLAPAPRMVTGAR